jgi:hypothetical protein
MITEHIIWLAGCRADFSEVFGTTLDVKFRLSSHCSFTHGTLREMEENASFLSLIKAPELEEVAGLTKPSS